MSDDLLEYELKRPDGVELSMMLDRTDVKRYKTAKWEVTEKSAKAKPRGRSRRAAVDVDTTDNAADVETVN